MTFNPLPPYTFAHEVTPSGALLHEHRFSKETLRDYFAALAMQTFCQDENHSYADAAKMAYGQADAMLAAREPKPTPQQDNVDTWEVN